MMKIEEYYDDLENPGVCVKLHEQVADLMTLNELISVVVCLILQIYNHYTVEEKINKLDGMVINE